MLLSLFSGGNAPSGVRPVPSSVLRAGTVITSLISVFALVFYVVPLTVHCPKPNAFFWRPCSFEDARSVARPSRADIVCQTRASFSFGRLSYIFWCYLFIFNLISITIKTCLVFNVLHVQLITTNCIGIKHVFNQDIFPQLFSPQEYF